MIATTEIPVLIVGGGPTGLAASLALSRCGVRSLLVDKHRSTSSHPKATVVNVRTMELLRQWGLDEEVTAAGIPAQDLRCVCWVTTMAGFEVGRIDLTGDPERVRDAMRASPTVPVMCPQDVLEPILHRAAAAQAPAEVRYGHELVGFDIEPDGSGVTAAIRDVDSGRSTTVRARYIVGCDGRSSTVREQLGIELTGKEPLGDMLNIYVRADLRHLVEHRLSPLYWLVNPDAMGVFITLDGAERWLLNIPYDAATESPADYPPERCAALARRAIGDPEVGVEVLSMHAWQMTRLVATRFRAGPVFLAGDAAHQFPPTGGHGMNSGIQDAHNLAWKVAAVLDGWADDGLLDSYDAERRPIAETLTAESVGNAAAMRGQMRPPPEVEHDTDEGRQIRELIGGMVAGQRGHFVSTGLILGASYPAGALVPEADADGGEIASDVEHYVAVSRAGHRAPHVPQGDGSSLDLYERTPILLAGHATSAWADATVAAAESTGVPVRFHAADVEVAAAYGITGGGAVLVRPDGYIAWRANACSDDRAAALVDALTKVFAS